MNKHTFSFCPNGQLAEISVIAETKDEAEALVRDMIPDKFLGDGLSLQKRKKTTLYMALYSDSPCNQEWKFTPQPFDKLWFVLNFLKNEAAEDEADREIRVMALLNGEVVCTNFAAYKLVRE